MNAIMLAGIMVIFSVFSVRLTADTHNIGKHLEKIEQHLEKIEQRATNNEPLHFRRESSK